MAKFLIRPLSLASLIFVFAFCCDDDCFEYEPDDNALIGSWLLYERGYSPGQGYLTEPVSETPPQIVSFFNGGRLSASIEGWDDFKFYFLLQDSNDPAQTVLAIYKTLPAEAPTNTSELEHSYIVTLSEGNLKLNFRWCIEGCHLRFKPL